MTQHLMMCPSSQGSFQAVDYVLFHAHPSPVIPSNKTPANGPLGDLPMFSISRDPSFTLASDMTPVIKGPTNMSSLIGY